MTWINQHLTRVRSFLGRRKLDAEMDEEMQSHVELRTKQNIAAGMDREEAHRAAILQFGWVESIQSECREQRRFRWLEEWIQDTRFGARQLRKDRGFTCIGVLAIALGIGAVTTQFSLLNGVLLRNLPFAEPNRLVRIALRDPSRPADDRAPSVGDFIEWQRRQQSCDGLAASDSYRWLNVTINGAAKPLPGLFVTHNFFSLLGVRPVTGRDFNADDDRPGAERVALISHELWMRDFGGVPDILGRSLRFEGQVTTVVGVMPPHFTFPGREQIWTPLVPYYLDKQPRGQAVNVLARLKAGIVPEQAEAEFGGIANQLAREFPEANKSLTAARVEPLRDDLVGGMRDMLWALFAAAALVLAVACVNVMNLQFVRVSARMRELSMRGALGASRGRLLRQMLAEGMLLVLAGSAAGVTLTRWSTRIIRAELGQVRFDSIPGWVVTDIDATVLAFTVIIIAGMVLASSLLPALCASRADAMFVLKKGAHGQSNQQVSRLGGALIVAQISLTCVLLVGSLLQLKSIRRHANVDMGFKTESLMAGRMSLEYGYRTPEARNLFYRRLLSDLRANPQFTHVALTSRSLAVMGGRPERFQMEGGASSLSEQGDGALLEYISDGYFATLGLRLRQGREFDAGEFSLGEPSALVNDTFAQRHFGGGGVLGRRIRLLRSGVSPEWRRIVGVVPDTHLEGPFDRQFDGAGVFLPMEENVSVYPTVLVRGGERGENLAEPLRRAIGRIDPDLTLYGVGTPRANLLAANGRARTIAALSSVFAVVAAVLATIGLYGVASFAVSQRTKDFGIRMALGAPAKRIMAMVFRQGLIQFSLGGAGGLILALWFTQIAGARFEGFLYKVSPHDAGVYGAVILLLAMTTLLACWIPALRAAQTDPMIALRSE